MFTLKTAPLGATKFTKVNDQQQIYCLYLLSLFIPCPALLFHYFFTIASRAQTSESTWSYLSFQYSSNSYFPTWRCFDRAIRSSSVFLWSSCLNLFLNSTSRSRLAKCDAIYPQISENTSLVNRRARMCLNHVCDKLHSV